MKLSAYKKILLAVSAFVVLVLGGFWALVIYFSEEKQTEPVVVTPAYATKSDLVSVYLPLPGTRVSSPLIVVGEARGYWFFEASFPLVLVAANGTILAEGYAAAEGDWMTEDFVPFIGTLTYTLPEELVHTAGTLILKKDNPSGLPEYDDSLEIPVWFE